MNDPFPGPDEGEVNPASVRSSPTIAKLAVALTAAQAEVGSPVKNKQNPHLKNWYADLGAVLTAVMPALVKHKLAVLQLPCEMDGQPALMTLLVHESGEWIGTVAKTRPQKMDPQGVGSALSYARRYALQAVAGVTAEDDDDGEQAGRRPARPAASPAPAPVKQADPAKGVAAVREQLARTGETLERLNEAMGLVKETPLEEYGIEQLRAAFAKLKPLPAAEQKKTA